jgi:hypothetical protein
MTVYPIEQNIFIVSYFRSGRFVNDEWTYSLSVGKNELQAKYPENTRIHDDSLLTHIRRIVNRFLTTRTRVNHQDGHQYLMKLSRIREKGWKRLHKYL